MDKPKPWLRFSLASMLSAIAVLAALCAGLLPSWRGIAPKFPLCVAGAQAGAKVNCTTCHANAATVQTGLAYLNERPSNQRRIPDPPDGSGHPGPMRLVAGQANQCTQCHIATPAKPAVTKQLKSFRFGTAAPAHDKPDPAPGENP
jgi:hypothetical protein